MYHYSDYPATSVITLYHVSFDLYNKSCMFHPRVPESAGDGEDKVTERICLSTSVEGCMKAIGPCDRNLGVGSKFILRTVQMEYPNPNLVCPGTLYESGRVPDALETNEYWCLYPLIFGNVMECEITRIDVYHDMNWTCIKIDDCREIINKHCEDFNPYGYTNSRELYSAFVKWGENADPPKWDEIDDVWDDLLMLPYGQGLTINELGYKLKEV